MVGKPKIHAGNSLQSLRLSVFEKMKADTGWRRQDQLAEALSVSPGMITAVLSGRSNFRLKDALRIRALCPSIGLDWIYFLTPAIHDDLRKAFVEQQPDNGRPKPR